MGAEAALEEEGEEFDEDEEQEGPEECSCAELKVKMRPERVPVDTAILLLCPVILLVRGSNVWPTAAVIRRRGKSFPVVHGTRSPSMRLWLPSG